VAVGTVANPIVPATTKGLETNKWGYIVAGLKKSLKDKKRNG